MSYSIPLKKSKVQVASLILTKFLKYLEITKREMKLAKGEELFFNKVVGIEIDVYLFLLMLHDIFVDMS